MRLARGLDSFSNLPKVILQVSDRADWCLWKASILQGVGMNMIYELHSKQEWQSISIASHIADSREPGSYTNPVTLEIKLSNER